MRNITLHEGPQYRKGDTLKTHDGEQVRVVCVNGTQLTVEPAPRSWAWLIALAVNLLAGAGLIAVGFLGGLAYHIRA